MATGDLSDPGGVISADPGGAAASIGPGGTTAAAVGTGASAGPTGASVMAAWLHLEVPAGSLEQGDRNSHNGSTCCWLDNTPLHDVLSNYNQCIG